MEPSLAGFGSGRPPCPTPIGLLTRSGVLLAVYSPPGAPQRGSPTRTTLLVKALPTSHSTPERPQAGAAREPHLRAGHQQGRYRGPSAKFEVDGHMEPFLRSGGPAPDGPVPP